LVDQGIKEGTIAPCDPKFVAAALFGAFNWVPHWIKNNDVALYAETTEQFLKIFIEGLRARG